MASPIPPRGPRPSYYPPGYNPMMQKGPDTLADGLQNMHITRPFGPPFGIPGSSTSRPSAFGPPTYVPPPASAPPSGTPSIPPGPPSAPPSLSFSRSFPNAPSSSFPSASPISRPGPPPFSLPRSAPPAVGPPQTAMSHSLSPGTSSVPPLSQPPPFGTARFPAEFATTPMALHSFPPESAHPPSSNGPSIQARGNLPTFGSTASSHHPLIGPPPGVASNAGFPPFGPPTASARGPLAPSIRPYIGPPSGVPSSQPSQPPPPFSTPSQAVQLSSASPYGSNVEQMQVAPGPLLLPGSMPPPRMYGLPPPPPNQSLHVPPVMGSFPVSGAPTTGLSKLDPKEMPRPSPSSSISIFETRQGGQANLPPVAASDYIVKDNGNCSPRYMRCTINQVPCSGDLLSNSCMQLALMVQPLAIPHPSEEPIHVIDLGECGPVRCSRCKGYANPFMKFIDQGRRFICNLCGFINETPRDYHCNLGPDGRRRDANERPELCRGTVEFVATKEFMVRDPMLAVYFFLIDVSMHAIQTGATAAACSAISQAITDLPEGPRTMVGIATFDSTIHFYNLKRALQQPLMLIVPDVQDVYTPLQSDVIVQLSECRQHLEQLLENIPSMFESNRVAESAFGAATKASFLAMKSTGGKLFVFQSVLPSVGFGALSAREADGRANGSAGEEVQKLLQPADKTLKSMAAEFAEYQVCVDIFITCQTYVDIASISVVPRTTGGQVYYYFPFSAVSDSGKLYNDLRWNITRPQGLEAVMRVRCSQGLQVQEYSGNFCKRIPTDVDLPAIDCDKAIMVTFKHDDKFVEGSECAFQCALLYTTLYGQRRIRVTTLSLTCTSIFNDLFRTADLETQFACVLKQAANDIPTNPLIQVREKTLDHCVNILLAYRKFCSGVSSSGHLILPETLKLLPLYTLALTKSIGLQNDGRLDDRSYWISRATSLPIPLVVPFVYPRMLAIHNLLSNEGDESLISATVPLSNESVKDDGILLLENGEDGLFYVGKEMNPDIVEQLFGVKFIEEIPTQLVLQQFDNELSKKLNNLVNEIRRQRCSYLRLRFCKKGDPSGFLFFSYLMEDKTPWGLAYADFIVHLHRQIQMRME